MINFNPVCTIPTSSPVFVQSPNLRGTLDILFDSISILVLCTWSVLRLNVPAGSTPETTRQKMQKKLQLVTRKSMAMLLTLFAPEIQIGKSMTEYISGTIHTKRFHRWAKEDVDNVPWSRAHTSFADMGGFVLLFPGASEEPKSHGDLEKGEEKTSGSAGTQKDKQPDRKDDKITPVSVAEPLEKADAEAPADEKAPVPTDPTEKAIPELQCGGSADIHNKQRDLEQDKITPASTTESIEKLGIEPRSDEKESVATNAVEKKAAPPSQRDPAQRGKRPDAPGQRKKEIPVESIRAAFEKSVSKQSSRFGPVRWAPYDKHKAISEQIIDRIQTEDPDQLVDTLSLTKTSMHNSGMRVGRFVRTLIVLEGDTWTLSAAQLLEARKVGIIDQLPRITDEALEDKDKGDFLVKIAAIYQVVLLYIQLIVRQVSGLPSSPLEIMTLAFSVCALIMYILNWSKPKDAECPVYLRASRSPTPDEMRRLALLQPQPMLLGGIATAFANNPVPQFNWGEESSIKPFGSIECAASGIAYGGMLFGAIHLLAWNFPFPTKIEQMLWRICAIFTTVGPVVPTSPLFILLLVLRRCTGYKFRARLTSGFWALWALCVVVARLFLLVEAYRSVFYLPPLSFVTTWTSDIPHLG